MNRSPLLTALLATVSLAACDRPSMVAAPVGVPGPASPQGAPGATGEPGETGETGSTGYAAAT